MGNCVTKKDDPQNYQISEQIRSNLPEQQQMKLMQINLESVKIDNNLAFTTRDVPDQFEQKITNLSDIIQELE